VSFVELSIPDPGFKGRPRFDSSLDLWGHTAQQAQEPCLVLDVNAVVVAASPGCGELFAFTATDAVGRRLIDVLRLLDFNAVAGKLPEWEVDKIPPLLAISTAVLARGLLRVRGADGPAVTVDAISVPLRDGVRVVGSLTFFAPVGR
jgi:PAS domain-containing protein